MADRSFNIGFNTAIGWGKHLPFPGTAKPERVVVGKDFPELGKDIIAVGEEFKQVTPGEADPSLITRSMFGTPMFFVCTLGGVKLPNAPLITVQGIKRIVSEDVAGGDFSVIEIIGLGAYRIQIQGYAINEPGHEGGGLTIPQTYPADWVRELDNLHKRKEALDVECELLSYFGIQRLVIEDIKFAAAEGAEDYVPYQITALSDVPVELELKQTEEAK